MTLSKKYNSEIYLKREDQQTIRSFKIRGALNKIIKLINKKNIKGFVVQVQGNHAQGVALASSYFKKCKIFVPKCTFTENKQNKKILR